MEHTPGSLEASPRCRARVVSAPQRIATLTAFSLALGACATTELRPAPPPAAAEQSAAVRPERRAVMATMPTMMASTLPDGAHGAASGPQPSRGAGAAFGSPTVAPATTASDAAARVQRRNGSLLVECEGNELAVAPSCPQCPAVPEPLAQRRLALSREDAVLRCEPPYDSHGRLAVHVTMRPAGVVSRVSFPHAEVSEEVAACLGRALCTARTATFREPEARFDYEYVIAR